MQSMVDKDAPENWIAPDTLAVLDNGSDVTSLIPEQAELKIDLNTWTPADVVNIASATVCALVDEDLYLVLMSRNSNMWLVEMTLRLDEFGTTALFGDSSYCQSHL